MKFSVNLKTFFKILVIVTLLVTSAFLVIQIKAVIEGQLFSLMEENGALRAKVTTLEADKAALERSRQQLITYSESLLKASETQKELVTSRGLESLESSGTIDRETYTKIHKLTLENQALRGFYEKTTGFAIDEIREVAIESTMFTNAEGWWPSDSPNYGMMKSGKFGYHGAVAAPSGIPLGSTVLFNGDLAFGVDDTVYTVEDRGGRIIDNGGSICIDIWTDDLIKAKSWGRQKDTTGYVIIHKEE